MLLDQIEKDYKMIYLNNHLSSNPVEIPVTLPPIACHEIHK